MDTPHTQQTSTVETVTRPLADAIRKATDASTVVVLIKNEEGYHCVGDGNFNVAHIVFSIASELSKQMALVFDCNGLTQPNQTLDPNNQPE